MQNRTSLWSLPAMALLALFSWPKGGFVVNGALHESSGTARHSASPTYAKDIAPLINARCVSCHRPGEVAPFSLIGFENAKLHASMIAAVTESRRMPPWKAVHGYGEFRDENRLTDGEIALVKTWTKAGAPRGDRKQESKPPTFSSEWALGTPDLVVSQSKPFNLGAEGNDVYRNFVIKTNFDKPTWVKAIDLKPGNKKIVHHMIAYLDDNGGAIKMEQQNHDGQEGYTSAGGGVGIIPSGLLGGWAPGLRPRYTPDGIAFKLNPHSTIVMQMHYHRSGKPEQDQTKLALYFAKEPITQQMDMFWAMDFGLKIPAAESAHKIVKEITLPMDITFYAAMPHMHLLGRTMKAWFDLPDGKRIPYIYVNDWDFNWQLSYALAKPLSLPRGTKLHVEATYDNSSNNPRNPNSPPKTVTWGEQTTDEMFLLLSACTLDRTPKPVVKMSK